jgi:hypothetical protein
MQELERIITNPYKRNISVLEQKTDLDKWKYNVRYGKMDSSIFLH